MKPDRETYKLELAVMPGFNSPGIQRLKMALKRLSRDYGLRCVGILPGVPAEQESKPETGNAPRLMSE